RRGDGLLDEAPVHGRGSPAAARQHDDDPGRLRAGGGARRAGRSHDLAAGRPVRPARALARRACRGTSRAGRERRTARRTSGNPETCRRDDEMRARTLLFAGLAVLLLAGCAAEIAMPPAPPLAVEAGANPEAWALIPAGEFLKGQFEEDTLLAYDYEIMVTPVTNAQYAAYLNEALAAGAISVGEDG